MKVYFFYMKVDTKEPLPTDNVFINEHSRYLSRRATSPLRGENIYHIKWSDDGIVYIPYGVTNKKKLKDAFLSTRDMSKFVMQKKDMTRKEYAMLLNNLYDDIEIVKHTMYARYYDDDAGNVNIVKRTVAVTDYEYVKVTDDLELIGYMREYLSNYCEFASFIPCQIFKREISDALVHVYAYNTLPYLLYDIYGSNDADIDMCEDQFMDLYDYLVTTLVHIQDLYVFEAMFGDTMRKDWYEESISILRE